MAFRLGCLLVLFSTAAHASDLGADGRLHFADDAVLKIDFEDATATSALLRKLPSVNDVAPTYAPVATTDVHLVASNDALEGRSSLHVQFADATNGFAIVSPTFAQLVDERVSVSYWGRAEGMEPYVEVTYGTEADATSQLFADWAQVPTIRTGRETTDGWVEYSTGAIDGSVLAHPIHHLTITGRVPSGTGTTTIYDFGTAEDTDAFTLDAIELRIEPGAPSTATCTMANIDTTCGPVGECFYGRCIDSAVVWQPVPPIAMQQEIVGRLVHWISYFLGDRHAVANLPSGWIETTLALARPDATARSFWGGLNRQMTAVRDTHTWLGAPYTTSFTTAFGVRPRTFGALDACFGPTVNDLGDGTLAYVVWSTGKAVQGGLQVGDIVTSIDGRDPKTWALDVMSRYDYSLPVDPRSDWAPTAKALAGLLAQHASTLVVSRCAGTVCTPQPAIDVATIALGAISNGYERGTIGCTPRFSDSVSAPYDTNGNEIIVTKALDPSTEAIEFDGFSPNDYDGWVKSLDLALSSSPGGLIFDAREGYGGLNDLGAYMIASLRGTGSRSTLALAARGTFLDPNAPSLTSFDWSQCTDFSVPECATADIFLYDETKAKPAGASSKIAWLNTDDVSNNDMVPRVLKGRDELAIFAPFPTYGALGSDVVIPALVPGFADGSIAASDGRYGSGVADAESKTTCESGTGVVPDFVTTQTLSDVLAGKDTMLIAARAWLAQ